MSAGARKTKTADANQHSLAKVSSFCRPSPYRPRGRSREHRARESTTARANQQWILHCYRESPLPCRVTIDRGFLEPTNGLPVQKSSFQPKGGHMKFLLEYTSNNKLVLQLLDGDYLPESDEECLSGIREYSENGERPQAILQSDSNLIEALGIPLNFYGEMNPDTKAQLDSLLTEVYNWGFTRGKELGYKLLTLDLTQNSSDIRGVHLR